MSRVFLSVLVLFFSVFVTAMEYEVEFQQSQIQEQIDLHLPVVQQTALAEIEVHDANLTLLDKRDRIEVEAHLNLALLGGYKTQGVVLVESGLRYEPKSGSFYFHDVKVKDLKADQVPQALLPQLAVITEQILNQILVSYPVYTLDTKEINQHMLKSSLKAIKVRDKKLVAVMVL